MDRYLLASSCTLVFKATLFGIIVAALFHSFNSCVCACWKIHLFAVVAAAFFEHAFFGFNASKVSNIQTSNHGNEIKIDRKG